MSIPIEDTPADIVRKAMTGLGLRDENLEDLAGVGEVAVRAFKTGTADAAITRRLAPHLGLDADRLLALAHGYPAAPAAPAGLLALTLACPTPAWPDMTVNAYAIHPPGSRECLLIDTGTDAAALLSALAPHGLTPVAVLLTHGHFDHADGLVGLRAGLGRIPAYAHPADAVPDTTPIIAGESVTLGSLTLTARATPGHTAGGLTWVVAGPGAPLAFTGDAVFAGSVGGAPRRLREALAAVRTEILTLPPATVLASGHGPLTTVATECARNPFFGA